MRSRGTALVSLFLAAILVVGCEAAADEPAAPPLDIEVEVDPDNPLRAELSLVAATGSEPTVEVVDEEGDGFRLIPPATSTENQAIPLLGLRADTTYTLDVTLEGSSGSTSFTTGAVPDDFPPIEVESDPERMTPGLTLFNATPLQFGGGGGPTDDGFLLAVDDRGELVWYHRQTHSVQDIRRTESGDILYINHETGVKSLDVVENTVTEWSGTTGLDEAPVDDHGRPYAGDDAIRVETDQMHHEVIELPDGNLMTLSRELREIDGFPEPICDEDEEFEGTYQVVADTVVEFEPEDGSVVTEWSIFDLVDPMSELDRIQGPEFCSQYLEDVYPERGARDWTHANAVVLDEERNALLVSVRHLDQVLALRYQDDDKGPAGELLWRLGRGGDFELVDGEWFLYQHAPQVLEDGTIMIYDNGNRRQGTSLEDPDNLPYSRAVQYSIDTENWTAEQVWEHRADAPGQAVYAPFVGDADMLGGNTVLITHGGLLDPPAHSPQAEGVTAWGRIIEVDYDTEDTVFDLRVKDPAAEASWIIYRSERIPTIYPEGYLVEEIGG